MYHFIPAWYPTNRIWYDDSKEWGFVNHRLQFDDTVNQVKVFYDNQQEVDLLVLNYSPNLRSFLHQKGLFEVPSWSLFDQLQNTENTPRQILNWREFQWPKQAEFVYSPFAVTVIIKDKVYARIHFADGGYLYKIILVEEASTKQKANYIFDDRGFLSSILYFENGQAIYQDYLDNNGHWRFREYLDGRADKIIINQDNLQFLKESTYQNWEDVIKEILTEKLAHVSSDDYLVVAAHPQHNHLFKDSPQKTIYSFFQERFPLAGEVPSFKDIVSHANLLISDNHKNTDLLIALMQEQSTQKPILQVSPFDTRFELGLSVRRKELDIYFYIDGLSDKELKSNLTTIFKMMQANDYISLILGTYENNQERNQGIKQLLMDYIDQYVPEELPDPDEMLPTKDVKEVPPRARLEVIKDENDLIYLLKTTRLMIDLNREPDLYHQIAAISSGLPQINASHSDYVTHQKNGYIISDHHELEKAINYFFKGLSNWNKSLVFSIEKIAEFTGPALIEKWTETLEGRVSHEQKEN
ncbi:accessory Sec system protein Asp1 [Streptococcus parauberis]|uniref:accessory Sec system protein Asp1 n=1 Tax=Streptococcus parauberis TaxID=1348 RepID=UPI000E309D83|nr:accessory Sec system protein Asp1 [Streptococcus parauberis]RFE02784.1 hypothetical protein ADO06_00038 [Streptococcus parauberis]